MNEQIRRSPQGDWVCCCGNTPEADGFHPCDGSGRPVEPTPAAWQSNCYLCARCDRIINHESLVVVGRRVKNFSICIRNEVGSSDGDFLHYEEAIARAIKHINEGIAYVSLTDQRSGVIFFSFSKPKLP